MLQPPLSRSLLRAIVAVPVILVLALLTGCPPQEQPSPSLPPLPATEQFNLLNQQAAAIQTLRLTGDVKLTFVDSRGNSQSYDAHGVLLIDKRPENPELLLTGTYLGQEVFEMGMNQDDYWLINYHDKVAFVGAMAHADSLPDDVMPLRPQRILSLLAITELVNNPQEHTVFITNAPPYYGTNVLVVQIPNDEPAWVNRRLYVNPYDDRVHGVTLYTQNGFFIASSNLDNYQIVASPDGQPASVGSSGPEIPFSIDIKYPAAGADLDIKVNKASPSFTGDPQYIFATPSFQGLQIVDMDDPANWPAARSNK
jgi:hypothetical protein